jgi:hypothetical protein
MTFEFINIPLKMMTLLGFGLNDSMWPGLDYIKGSLGMLDFLVSVEVNERRRSRAIYFLPFM